MKKILFVVNVDWFFMSHRLPIALAAIDEGYEVHLACEFTDKETELSNLGIIVHQVPFSRSGKGLKQELSTLVSLYNLFKAIKPDIVHCVTIKPVLYGGIIARLTKVPAFVAAISGLGLVFVAEGLKAKCVRFIVKALYRLSFGHKNMKAIFQNTVDENILVKAGIVKTEGYTLIKGSGAELNEYKYKEEPVSVPTIIMAARLLREKGVLEFIEMAKQIKERGIKARFILVGEPDYGNPNSFTTKDLEKWKEDGFVNILGHRDDIAELFSESNIVVLPSYYGEGLPKVLIEAAACGRAIVTTDNPGCRDAVIPNKTGLIVSVKDSVALSDAVTKLIEDKELRMSMGKAGRAFAEKEFDVKQVVNTHLQIYQYLLAE
jgi:glycosyltransferase involved in cell wall biosynthesis